jgi:hypothetical protein
MQEFNQAVKTNGEILKIVEKVTYKDWDIVLRFDDKRPYIQIQFEAPDSFTGVVERQHCRKWMLSRFMTNSEIVRTIYKAIEAAVLHEMQEDFRYDDEPIFRPHMDIEALWDISSNNMVDKRE